MQENKIPETEIDELIGRIDSFMKKGGGHMNIKSGKGKTTETRCTSCCGESSDTACMMPAEKEKN